MGTLFALCLALIAAVMLPLMLIGLLLKVLVWLVLIPLKLVGFVLKLAVKLVLLPVFLLFGGLALFLVAVVAPLLPFLILAGLIYGLFRVFSPRVARSAA